MLKQINSMLRMPGFRNIARRYFIVNGFDGALTMLGLLIGFYISERVSYSIMLSACLGAAIALGMSGLTSAYISESAEKKKELNELEQAMIEDLGDTNYGQASRLLPIMIALVNSFSPLLISFIVISPIAMATWSVSLPYDPVLISLSLALCVLFMLGVYLAKVSQTNWLWAGVRTLLITIITVGLILLLSPAS